jgi:hypothetical protein
MNAIAATKREANGGTGDAAEAAALGRLVSPGVLLRAESSVVLAPTGGADAWHGGSWWVFAVLLLAPDASILGYLAGNRVGATAYNLVHAFMLPGVLLALGAMGSSLAFDLGLIWGAHIAMDRVFGYGLKGPGGFKETHLRLTGNGGSSSVDLRASA